MTEELPEKPSDRQITSRFPLTTVFSGFSLWHKWQREERPFTQNDAGQLTGEILWQMAQAWVNQLSELSERREITSEFIADVYALAKLESDDEGRDEIKSAATEEPDGE